MTENEWATNTDPTPMLEYLEGKTSERKERLFGARCCRLAWPWLTDPVVRRAVELSEAFVEDGGVRPELADAVRRIAEMNLDELDRGMHGVGAPGWWFVTAAVLEATGHPVRAKFVPAKLALAAEEMGCGYPLHFSDVGLVRDIFGNPFRPVACDPSWLTSTVVALADAMYTGKAFDRLPVLADALEEAGCDNADVLSHCRDHGPHVRGCCVVDLMLGKS